MSIVQRITPCLWFDGKVEQAVDFYLSIFDDSRILRTTRYTKEAAHDEHKEGSVLMITFQIAGEEFCALNAGRDEGFTPAISLAIHCEAQDEVDRYWDRLSAGGSPEAQKCGWLEDKFGVSWQVMPVELLDLLADADSGRAGRVTVAMMKMKKIDLAEIRRAAKG
jgi:predicted 3-demethylubiquinone-9 3-methyltransferase (glyoxalase superfamily)